MLAGICVARLHTAPNGKNAPAYNVDELGRNKNDGYDDQDTKPMFNPNTDNRMLQKMRQRIHEIFHKAPLFAFLPWLAFWGQGGSSVADHARLRVAVSSQASACKRVEKSFTAVIARAAETRTRGLGGRSSPMAKDEGMLFIFDSPQLANFWMKDTLIPLEIAFFDSKGKLVKMHEMPVEPNPGNPTKQYPSLSPVFTALEVAPNSLASFKNGKAILCVDTMPVQ